MKVELSSNLDIARRSCNRCFSHQKFNPKDGDKQLALNAIQRAKGLLKEAFDDLRAADAPIEQIRNVKEAKTLCFDAIDACNACKKERPQIKEIFLKIKQK